MSDSHSALSVVAQAPPCLAKATVAESVMAQFGLDGEFTPLVSERDQNFCLRASDGGRCLVKIPSLAEDPATTDFQVSLLQFLEATPAVRTPRTVPTLDGCATGKIIDGVASYRLRVATWVQGEQLETHGIDAAMAKRFGGALAMLHQALEGFSHAGEKPVLLWDLQRVCELRPLLGHIDDMPARAAVEAAIDDFELRVMPVAGDLRSQVIHSDANPENVLISDQGFGFIDFGDAIRAPLVYDLAIAASYLRPAGADLLELVAPFVAGYHATLALERDEAELLYDLVRARLATTITLLYWRLSARSKDDEYRRKSQHTESGASQFLFAVDDLGRQNFFKQISGLAEI